MNYANEMIVKRKQLGWQREAQQRYREKINADGKAKKMYFMKDSIRKKLSYQKDKENRKTDSAATEKYREKQKLKKWQWRKRQKEKIKKLQEKVILKQQALEQREFGKKKLNWEGI